MTTSRLLTRSSARLADGAAPGQCKSTANHGGVVCNQHGDAAPQLRRRTQATSARSGRTP